MIALQYNSEATICCEPPTDSRSGVWEYTHCLLCKNSSQQVQCLYVFCWFSDSLFHSRLLLFTGEQELTSAAITNKGLPWAYCEIICKVLEIWALLETQYCLHLHLASWSLSQWLYLSPQLLSVCCQFLLFMVFIPSRIYLMFSLGLSSSPSYLFSSRPRPK